MIGEEKMKLSLFSDASDSCHLPFAGTFAVSIRNAGFHPMSCKIRIWLGLSLHYQKGLGDAGKPESISFSPEKETG